MWCSILEKMGIKSRKMTIFGDFQPFLNGYLRLKFSIREVIFHNLLTIYLYFMLKKQFVAKNAKKMKNSSFFVKSPFWGTPTKMGVTILVLLGVILSWNSENMRISSFLAYLVSLVNFWKSWKIFDFDHILPNILAITPNFYTPRISRKHGMTWNCIFDDELWSWRRG